MLAAHQSWAGPASYASQRCLGTTRRPTAAAFRLYKLQTPFLGVTQQGSAPTQTQSDLNAVEEAMRVSKMGNGAVPGVRPAADSNKNPAQQVVESSLALKREFDKVKEEVSKYTKLCEENQQQQKEIERLQQVCLISDCSGTCCSTFIIASDWFFLKWAIAGVLSNYRLRLSVPGKRLLSSHSAIAAQLISTQQAHELPHKLAQ